MNAVHLRRHGPPEVLRIEQVPDPTPGDGQVLVRVQAVGLNYAEVLSRKGLYGWTPDRPYILGMEGAGVIEAFGRGVAGRELGEPVLFGAQCGSYAELIVVDSAAAFPAVPGFSLNENAAFGVSYLTAWICLMEMARLRTTDRVLVTAAAGGLGTAAVQVASKFGCEVIALAGSDKKLEKARELGADVTVRYGDPEFPRRLAEAVGPAGVDVVLETVGGDVFTACDALVAPFGRVIVAGYAELDYKLWNPISCWKAWNGRPRMRLESMLKGSKGLLSAHLGYLLQDAALVKRVWSDLSAFAEEHTIRPVVGHVLTLDEVAAAHRLMESRASVGKIVLRV